MIATVLLALAILHTFSVKIFQKKALQHPEGSIAENFFHLLSEIEIAFGIWAAGYLAYLVFSAGTNAMLSYLNSLRFTEPAFVFVILIVCSTKPILYMAESFIEMIVKIFTKLLPLNQSLTYFIICILFGSILGSFITEPAAMTVTSLLLYEKFLKKKISIQFKYAILGLLFVSISIGGTLTHFAAPPVLMVARKWNWNFSYLFFNFGIKAFISIFISTVIIAARYHKEFRTLKWQSSEKQYKTPTWVCMIHLLFLITIIHNAHHALLFAGIFFFFVGFANITKEYQTELNFRQGFLIAFFLAGVVILGTPQSWWLEPVLAHCEALSLYWGSIALTAIIDNAALTYMGTLVPHLSDASRYFLVAGSVVGGGLTVIANAPNLIGYTIASPAFGKEGISPLKLLQAALLPTVIAALCFLL